MALNRQEGATVLVFRDPRTGEEFDGELEEAERRRRIAERDFRAEKERANAAEQRANLAERELQAEKDRSRALEERLRALNSHTATPSCRARARSKSSG